MSNKVSATKSLASNKQYVLAQVDKRHGKYHFQVACPEINRDYGLSFNASGGAPALDNMLNAISHVPSLTGSGKPYMPCQIRARNGYVLHVQVKGPEINREYGVAVDLDVDQFAWEQVKGLQS